MCQSPLLTKCNTERQRKTDAAEGAAAHGWIAACISAEWPAGPAATSSP